MSSFVCDSTMLEAFAARVFRPADRVVLFVSARRKYGMLKKARGAMSMNRQELRASELHSRVCRASAVPGAYVCDDGTPITRDQMACYVCINARDPARARRYLHEQLVATAYAPPHSEPFMAALGVSALMKPGAALKRWVTIDVDDPNRTLAGIVEACAKHEVRVDYTVETRGGYHLLFDLLRMSGREKKAFFTQVAEICKQYGETVDTDMPCPVPGTLQGGRRVVFYAGPPDLTRRKAFVDGVLAEQRAHGDPVMRMVDTTRLGVDAIDRLVDEKVDFDCLDEAIALAAASICLYRFDAESYAREPAGTDALTRAVRAVAQEIEADWSAWDGAGHRLRAHRAKYVS